MKNISIFFKILIVFVAISLIAISINSFTAINIFRKTIIENNEAQFRNELLQKKGQIERYYKDSELQAESMSRLFAVKELFKILSNYHNSTSIDKNDTFPVNNKRYTELTNEYQDYFKHFVEQNNYSDLLFICTKHGHIMFSAAQNNDLGTNLSTGKYKDSHLAKLWKEVVAKKTTIISDSRSYAPSNGKETIFIGTPVLKNDKIVGVLVVEISIRINNSFTHSKNKLYKSQETYIAGNSFDGNYRLKSHKIVQKGIPGDIIDDELIIKSIEDSESGQFENIASDNKHVYVYYTPLEIKNRKWTLFSVVEKDEVLEPIKKEERGMLLVLIFAILLIIISAYLLSKSISNPINKVVKAMQNIAKRKIDFQIEDKRKDEIGKLYNSINEINTNFKDVLIKINNSASSVLDAGNQLSAVSQEISERANVQASTTEEVAAAMEEMVATINSNTENAEYTGKISAESAKKTEVSNRILQQTIETVNEISEKISIISEIADKTDILSINAAIEAARAGDEGKGFAVVANEIRKLADKTKIASEKINELSSTGKNVSQIAGKTLAKLIPDIINSTELVGNIVLASKEQESNVEDINTSIQQLSEITNQNSASAEQMSAAAEELSSQAEQLKQMIGVFDIGEADY